jgi:hypothetical protein
MKRQTSDTGVKIALLENWHGDGVGTAVTLRFD